MDNFLELKTTLRANLVELENALKFKYSKEFCRFSDVECDSKYDSRDELQDVLDYINKYITK